MDDKLKKLLHEMQDVKRGQGGKQKTWKKLEGLEGKVLKNRNQKTWQYRIVLAVMSVCMLFFIFITWANDEVPFQQTANDEQVPIIQSAYFIDSAQDDVFLARDSRLYLGVRKLDSSAYKQLEQYLKMKETMNKDHEYNKEIQSERDLLINYSDGKVVRLKWYKYGEHNLTFRDWDTKKFYVVPIEFDDENFETMRQFEEFFGDPLFVSFSLLVLIIIYSATIKILTKKYQLPKKLKVYPYKWAMVLDIVLVIITYCTMMVLAFSERVVMYFGWILLIAIVHFMYHYWLDRQLPTLKGRLLYRICGIVYGYSIIVCLFVMM